MLITVDETFDNDHRVVSQRAPSKGRFTFTAQDSGDHRICFRAWNVPASGWLSGGVPAQGGVKFTLDLVIGETSKIESDDRGKVEDLVGKVKDLNRRLEDIRREQVFQRVSTALRCCSSKLLLTAFTGARSRVQKPVGDRQCSSGALDNHSVGGFGRYLCLATFALAFILHQAKIDLAPARISP